jgi:hypothetical protein
MDFWGWGCRVEFKQPDMSFDLEAAADFIFAT